MLFLFFFIFSGSSAPLAQSSPSDCKGPADVMIVIDHSANMTGSKFDVVKNASVDFIYKNEDGVKTGLFSIEPNAVLPMYNYHQVGLVAFNNNVDVWPLYNDDDNQYQTIQDVIIETTLPGVVSDPNGVLQNAVGSSNVTEAIKSARNRLNVSANNEATKTIIILISGSPDNLSSAIDQVRIVKENDPLIRTIAIGVNIDEIADDEKRENAINFISNQYIFPNDCHYTISNPGVEPGITIKNNPIENCNYIEGSLDASLESIYNDITAAVCDDSAPTLTILRVPSGTLYSVDKFTIFSNAGDNFGFSEHYITWYDFLFPDDKQIINDCSLSGKNISCNTGEIGPFSAGRTINYNSVAVDMNNNSVEIDPVENAKIASVSITPLSIFRNKDNLINVTVSDPEGMLNSDEKFYIRVENGDTNEVIISEEAGPSSEMSCSGTGFSFNCTYNLNPDCDDGIYSGSSVNIYIYAKNATGFHGPLANLDRPLGYLTNCDSGIDSDCDGTIDSDEISCDASIPIITKIERVSPPEGADVFDTTGSVTIISEANDSTGIKENKIQYRVQGTGIWSTYNPVCVDLSGDGKCDADGQDTGSVTTGPIDISSYLPGTVIEFRSVATDNSGNNNFKESEIKSFLIKSFECDFEFSDFENCTGGQCCGGVCNTSVYNSGPSGPYDADECTRKTCNGTRLELEPDPTLVGNPSCIFNSGGSDYESGCYSYQESYGSDLFSEAQLYFNPPEGGCEMRNLRCYEGYCEARFLDKIKSDDYCGYNSEPLRLADYSCVGGRFGSCDLISTNENSICDTGFGGFDWINAYASDDLVYNSSDDLFISGKSNPAVTLGEVLENKNVLIWMSANDASGVDNIKVYLEGVNIKTCDCAGANSCTCQAEKTLAYSNIGQTFDFYAIGIDTNSNTATTDTYRFKVLDSDCSDIVTTGPTVYHSESKSPLTSCGEGAIDSGKCCGGTCNSTISNPNLYDNSCYTDSCTGTLWTPNLIPNDPKTSCGGLPSCSPFYTGCQEGNICISGYCNPDPIGIHIDTCGGADEKHLTDKGCEGGICGIVSGGTNIDCSVTEHEGVSDYDGDSASGGTVCNCDCGGYDIEEKVYSSLSFDGANDYVNIPSINLLRNGSTLTFWAKTNTSGSMAIFAKDSNAYYSMIEFRENSFRLEPDLNNNDCSWTITRDTNWHFYALVFENNKAFLWQDDNYIGETNTYSSYSQLQNNLTLYNIGMRSRYVGYFNGSIDEVRIYDRVLSGQEVADQYDSIFIDNTNLVVHWDFDEGTGETVGDSSGNGNDGSLSNVDGKLYNMNDSDWVSGKYGNGLDFDGSNDYVSVSANSFKLTNNTTLSLWMKLDTAIGSGAHVYYPGIFSASSGGGWNDFITFRSSGDKNRIVYEDADGATRYSSLFSYNTGDWIHVAISMDSSRVPTFYINGNPEGSGAASSYVSLNYLGRGYAGATSDGAFNGLIDEVRIYNRALSDTEAEEHYRGIFTDNSDLVGYWNFNETAGTIAHDSAENGPKWMKHYYGSLVGNNGNVPPNWQVCTDNKDNDCDGYYDEYDIGDVISACDGSLDSLSIKAEAWDGTGETLVEITTPTVNDVDVSRGVNDFTLSTFNEDDFNIHQTLIEWTADNWATTENATCDTGLCEVCIVEGSCANNNIDLSLLASGSIFKYRTCATDDSVNRNMACTQDYTFSVTDTNNAPTAEALPVIDPDFCSAENLRYILVWNFDDVDPTDEQGYYEVQVKEGNNDFSIGPLVVNSINGGISNYHQIIKGNHNNNGIAESSTPVSLVDNDLTWIIDEWKNGEVKITSGDGSPQTKLIESNTEHEIFVNSWDTNPDSNFEYEIKSVDLEYEEKEYFWRVRVTDDKGDGFEKTSDWSYGPSFTTPLHKYPQFEFSANPVSDATKDCLYYETWPDDADLCKFGEDIIFHDETTFSAECINSDSTQCLSADKARCDGFLCAGCTDNSQCDPKFGSGYVCIGGSGICDPPTGFDCSDDSSNCKDASNAKCDSSVCVPCDEDAQCAKFTIKDEDDNDIEYICNAGKCEFPDHRKWDFYGNGYISSTNPNPINNYAGSVVNEYNVILKITDISGKDCSETMVIPFKGSRYPKWNEVSSSN